MIYLLTTLLALLALVVLLQFMQIRAFRKLAEGVAGNRQLLTAHSTALSVALERLPKRRNRKVEGS